MMRAIVMAIVAVLVVVAIPMTLYGLARYDDKTCLADSKGKSRGDIEHCLTWFLSRDCSDAQRSFRQINGETCVEYRLYGVAEVLAFYDAGGQFVGSTSPYE
jgi:hypothetical protein